MSSSTASITTNRITVVITPRQRRHVLQEMRRLEIGLSDSVRRLLDVAIDDVTTREPPKR